MTFARAFHAETLKLKRTIALKMVLIAPLAVVSLTMFMASQAPHSTLRRGNAANDDWGALTRVNLQFWGLLMLPLYVTLQTALIAGLDHSDNQWKALFARPVQRWTIYLSKLATVVLMAAASTAILVLSVIAEGRLLHWLDRQLGFGTTLPVARIALQAAEMTALAFLFLTIQHWVSLRWKSFSVAVGTGIVALVTSFAMLIAAGPHGTWPQYFPWSLPMLVIARHEPNIPLVLWISGLAAVAATAIGCVDFCKRDIS